MLITHLLEQYNKISEEVLRAKVAQLSSFHLNLHKVGLAISTLLFVFVVGVAIYVASDANNVIPHFVYTLLLSFMISVVFLFRPFLFKPPSKHKFSQLTQLHYYQAIFFIIVPLMVGFSTLLIDNIGVSIFINVLFIILLLEATRRLEGVILPIVIVIAFLLFVLLSEKSLMENLTLIFDEKGLFSAEGVYGEAFTTVIKIIYIFILFSFSLHLIKIDELLDIIAFKLTHERRSGSSAALYSILASSFYGAISGASDDNVEQTGRKTIPVMTQAGYPVTFAASVEAVSSVVGQLMPPIMGVVAFVIVEATDFNYLDIAFDAVIPVSLFILSLFVAVILEARKKNLKPLKLATSQETFEQVKLEEKTITPKSIVLIFNF